jgi:hypothetical protein
VVAARANQSTIPVKTPTPPQKTATPTKKAATPAKKAATPTPTKKKRPSSKTPKARSKSPAKVPKPVGEHAPLGARVSVYWPLDKKYFKGMVGDSMDAKGRVSVFYDDGDEETVDMRKQACTFNP